LDILLLQRIHHEIGNPLPEVLVEKSSLMVFPGSRSGILLLQRIHHEIGNPRPAVLVEKSSLAVEELDGLVEVEAADEAAAVKEESLRPMAGMPVRTSSTTPQQQDSRNANNRTGNATKNKIKAEKTDDVPETTRNERQHRRSSPRVLVAKTIRVIPASRPRPKLLPLPPKTRPPRTIHRQQ
jgi:hypothetical protein